MASRAQPEVIATNDAFLLAAADAGYHGQQNRLTEGHPIRNPA